jgi:hypothetical protein
MATTRSLPKDDTLEIIRSQDIGVAAGAGIDTGQDVVEPVEPMDHKAT